ncbi:hypothetical protein MBM_08379 [Drepanopeziza brunnea f. sp. 'multigermtubi' MB_m1]|uniref:Uncharacterized protein n=1 Tax=Marssonina brunnea f. sp. multigermtubi (strain MB_m1) TaxID=1072389 RepID=K1WLG0_MARBU|nr:uncharacterized protein MBM_08379 [Drepanopeziza brunnea f. sp. 'multigermtubi' MB_m1]EKD13661.1 hypothetical protein MBM_08379 [Drepanopeziza brunnea f. sp. 'multigermtubi' MB_m1]
MLTTVKALKCIKCINNKIISKSNKDCYNCDTSVIRCLRYAKSSYSNCTAAFAVINTAFDNFLALDAAFFKRCLANRSPMTRSASSISPFPLALAIVAFVTSVAFAAFVAFAAIVASVALIIVAPFALIVALAAFAAAPAVAITLTERRAKVKRLLRALVDLLL